MLGEIAVSSCRETENGCRAGALGQTVAPDTREAFQGSRGHLMASVARDPSLSPLMDLMLRVTATPSPTEDVVERLRTTLDIWEEKVVDRECSD